MGTGMVSTLLNTLPYNARWLYWISIVIFALNVLLFLIACIISFLRYFLYPEIFRAMISHPVQSMFIGTLPMGLATIVNMFCFVCVPAWGEWATSFAWTIWIIDAVISVVSALSLPFLLYDQRQQVADMANLFQDVRDRRDPALLHDCRLARPYRRLRGHGLLGSCGG